MKNSTQDKLFGDFKNKKLYKLAQEKSLKYIDGVLNRNVFPSSEALGNLTQFDENLNDEGVSCEEVIRLLDHYGAPATVAQLGGRYFGFVNGSAVPAGLIAKQMATVWDQNTALSVISPISAKLESVVQSWINDIFELPPACVSGFVTGTSAANFCALSAARYRLLKNQNWDVTEKGLWSAPKIRIIAGRQVHSSALKAVNMNGFGKEIIEWVDCDREGRIKPQLIPTLDNTCLVLLQAGNVNSGAFDNFDEICQLAEKAKAWVHIDGAFGLWAHCSKSLKHLTKGIGKASSWAVDGHKTLNTPYDCGVVICKDEEAIVSAMHMSGSYLVINKERDGMFYTADMSRRSRIVELWATLKYLGKQGVDDMVTLLHLRAKSFADMLRSHPGFYVLNNVVFNQIVVCCENDLLTDLTLSNVQSESICWAGPSFWKKKKVIRISVCSWSTTQQDIEKSFASFCRALKKAEANH